jgi:hypothetical protein
VIDERSLALGSDFTFTTQYGDLDLLGWVEPIGNFDEVNKRAEVYDFAGGELRTISLDDLIRVKQHIRRRQDSLYHLLAIKRVREEQGGR